MSSNSTTIDPTSPLYLHPSDGTNSISIEKLQGANNYRSWRRDFEISLSAKRKLGFITGGVKRDDSDPVKKESWNTCNDMVISWVLHSVSESIKKSVMFMGTAKQIWDHLEKRFNITNGARKYALNKQIHDTRQSGRLVSEYYTEIGALWEELESLTLLPAISEIGPEVAAYLKTKDMQAEEQKLFQFLNGLDELYGPQRSQILLMSPLPSVEEACSMIQQEESQREIFRQQNREDGGVLAMFSKDGSSVVNTYGRKSDVSCSNCGKTGHTFEKCWGCKVCGKGGHTVEECWYVKGFPNKQDKGKGKAPFMRNQSTKGRDTVNRDQGARGHQKWDKNKQGMKKVAGNVKVESEGTTNNNAFTAQQLEQLLKMLPALTKGAGTDTEDDLDNSYSGMVSCNQVNTEKKEWIIDSGATHHMSSCSEMMSDVQNSQGSSWINLPIGESAKITGIGKVNLSNDLKLNKVMIIPKFRHNLLSVQKLNQENHCKVLFLPQYCIVQDISSSKIKGIGRAKEGLYYLIDLPVMDAVKRITEEAKKMLGNKYEGQKAMAAEGVITVPDNIRGCKQLNKETLWHRRLGHAPNERIKKILEVKEEMKGKSEDLCVTCPISKFTKLPYTISNSRASQPFELIHLDIWGPYKVPTRGGHRYFLTIVDDNTRVTWVNLMKQKSEAFTVIHKFVMLVQNQYEKKVKRIRSDNALEFEDQQCTTLYNEYGIIHETSCVDTPQQNARVERKHRSILEMARSLRFQANLPLSYWGDSVLAAVYISNRLPSVVLNHKTPYEETVYMKLPPGYEGHGLRIHVQHSPVQMTSGQDHRVCKLLKSLYGLKQAPRQWYAKLKGALLEFGFVQSHSDSSLFIKKADEKITVILVYVDDLLIAGNDDTSVDQTKLMLGARFHMKDLGALRYFLGLEIDTTAQGIFISQSKYAQDLVKSYGLEGCKPLRLPMDSHIKLLDNVGTPLQNPEEYQKLVGKLIYLTLTRPDITFPVHVLSKFMHKPTSAHLQASKRVLRYLSGSIHQGILLASSSSAQLSAYCDSDWASCPNTRKSTSGYCILLGSSPIFWKSKRQSVVARSTAEAEARSMALTICEVMWLRQLLKELGIKKLQSSPIFCDNKAALAIAANPVYHERTKHLDIDLHFIRDQTSKGVIQPTYVPSSDQLADLLTKQLPVHQQQQLLSKLGVQQVPDTA